MNGLILSSQQVRAIGTLLDENMGPGNHRVSIAPTVPAELEGDVSVLIISERGTGTVGVHIDRNGNVREVK